MVCQGEATNKALLSDKFSAALQNLPQSAALYVSRLWTNLIENLPNL
jgi:hypothetical protein